MANVVVAVTAGMYGKAAQAMFAAWPQVKAGTAQGVVTRNGLYMALHLCLTQGLTWQAAVPQGMAIVGNAIAAHIKAGGSPRYAAAGYLAKQLGLPTGTALTAAQLAALTPATITAALMRHANFGPSIANYNGAATALAALTHGTAQATYMAPISTPAAVPQRGSKGNAVTQGWAQQQAPQPA